MKLGSRRQKRIVETMSYFPRKRQRSRAPPGTVKTRVLSSGRKLTYRKAAPVYNSSRYLAGLRKQRMAYPEGKTFDASTQVAPWTMFGDSSTAVSNSAGGYLLTTAATSSAIVINQVPLGTTSTTRIGRRLQMKRVRIMGRVQNGIGGALPGQTRMALVYIPTLDRGITVLPPQNVIWGYQDPNAQRVIDNTDRFKVLKVWNWDLIGDADAAATGKEQFIFDDMVTLNLLTEFTQADTTGSFNDMEKGALCLYCQGQQAAGSGSTILGTSRVYFDDL